MYPSAGSFVANPPTGAYAPAALRAAPGRSNRVKLIRVTSEEESRSSRRRTTVRSRRLSRSTTRQRRAALRLRRNRGGMVGTAAGWPPRPGASWRRRRAGRALPHRLRVVAMGAGATREMWCVWPGHLRPDGHFTEPPQVFERAPRLFQEDQARLSHCPGSRVPMKKSVPGVSSRLSRH